MKPSSSLALSLALFVTCISVDSRAWLFEEHAEIGREAVEALAPQERETLRTLWKSARATLGDRLCEEPLQRVRKTPLTGAICVDFGTLHALAADHSCSPLDLVATLHASWLPGLLVDADETAQLLGKPHLPAEGRVDIWHRSHLILQRDDDAYLSRAKKNDVHFLASRKATDVDLRTYLARVTRPSERLNDLEAYVAYHGAALASAAPLAATTEKDALPPAVMALLAEAMALHFLEDDFSAGHLVNTYGDAGGRKGTHDYYCEHGYQVTTWDGTKTFGMHGDAFMNEHDRAHTSRAVASSIGDLLAAVRGDRAVAVAATALPLGSLDICAGEKLPGNFSANIAPLAGDPQILAILGKTPAALYEGFEPPRFSSELGVFLRVSAAAGPTMAFAGYRPYGFAPGAPIETAPYAPRFSGVFQVGAGIGAAVKGVTTRSTDGLFYGQVSLASHTTEADIGRNEQAIQKHFALGGQARIPFVVVPGDALPIALLLWITDAPIFLDALTYAANGGIWGERVYTLSPNFSFQVVALREFGIYYSQTTEARALFGQYTITGSNGPETHIPGQTLSGLELDLPVFEFKLRQLYFGDIGGGAAIKLGALIDRYDNVDMPGDPRVGWAYSAFLKVEFEGRYYMYRP